MASGSRCRAKRRLQAQAPAASQLVDWLTDGGDNQRTGWAKNEKILTKQNVGSLKLLWTIETGNQPRALHSLMPVLVIGQLATAAGPKQVGIVNGISTICTRFDVETGKILWQKHWTYAPPAGRGGGGGGAAVRIRRKLGFLQPGGSSDTPVIGPADAQGRRAVYFVTGDGMLHIVNAGDRRGSRAALHVPHRARAGRSRSTAASCGWRTPTPASRSRPCNLDDPQHKVMTFNAGSGGAWGRRGVTLDSTGTAWTTTGDGVYDPTSDPPRYATASSACTW